MARRINRRGRKIYDFVDMPPPNNSLSFVLRDRRALFLHGAEPHNGSEMHTTAEQYSSQKKIHLFISTIRGKRWIAVHINNIAEAFKANVHSRSEKSKRSRKRKRTSLLASWETIIYEISLPHSIAPRFMEMKPFCRGVPKQVLRILTLSPFKRTTDLDTISLNPQNSFIKQESVND